MTNLEDALRKKKRESHYRYIHSNYHDYMEEAKELGEYLSDRSKKLLRSWRKRKEVN